MVFMPVRDDDATHFVALLRHIAEVRDDVIDTKHVVFREHDPGIDDQYIFAVFNGHHVLADLPQATKGDQPQGLATHLILYLL